MNAQQKIKHLILLTDAYAVDCIEEEKLVVVRSFAVMQ